MAEYTMPEIANSFWFFSALSIFCRVANILEKISTIQKYPQYGIEVNLLTKRISTPANKQLIIST